MAFPDQKPAGAEGGVCQPESTVIRFAAGLDASKSERVGVPATLGTPKLARDGPTPRRISVFSPSPLTTKPAIRISEDNVPVKEREEMLMRWPGTIVLTTVSAVAALVAVPALFVAAQVYVPAFSRDAPPLR